MSAWYVELVRSKDEKEDGKGRREDQRVSFHLGVLVDYLGYPLDLCFKRRDIGIRTKDLYEYAMYIYIYTTRIGISAKLSVGCWFIFL